MEAVSSSEISAEFFRTRRDISQKTDLFNGHDIRRILCSIQFRNLIFWLLSKDVKNEKYRTIIINWGITLSINVTTYL